MITRVSAPIRSANRTLLQVVIELAPVTGFPQTEASFGDLLHPIKSDDRDNEALIKRREKVFLP